MQRTGTRMRGQQRCFSSRQRWCLAGACELTQPPTEAVQGPWPGLAAPGPCLSCAATSATSPAWELSSSCGELALAGSHTSVQLLHPPAGQERKQEEKSKKLIRQNIDGEITYQVLLGAKQTQLREFIILGKKLTNLNIPFLQVSEGQLTAGPALLPCYHSKCQSVPSGREGGGSQKLLGAGVVPGTKWLLCAAPSFSLFPCALTLFLCGLQPVCGNACAGMGHSQNHIIMCNKFKQNWSRDSS